MNIEAIQTALKELEVSAGSQAQAHLMVEKASIYVFFRPQGYGIDAPSIIGYGKTPELALAEASAQWEKMSLSVRAEATKKIALAIIRFTHEQGVCTDAALRAIFSASDLEKYSTDALSLANTMAANGPFAILELAGANAA